MERFFEQIETQLRNELPFVVYKKPNSSELKAFFQPDNALHKLNDFTKSGFVFAPFDHREEAYLLPLEAAHSLSIPVDKSNITSVNYDIPKTTLDVNDARRPQAQEKHIDRVNLAIKAIEQGLFSKVVMSRKEAISRPHFDPIAVYKRLAARYPTAMVYMWYHPKVSLWMGATPETLLQVDGNLLKTMSLAGTQSFAGTTEVVWKDKEKDEQQIVTDFIVESLQASTLGVTSEPGTPISNDIKVDGPKTIQAGNLLHLQTEITLRLNTRTVDLLPIINALHPTPAVCGFPKEEAKHYIFRHEGYKREFYAGYLGELNFQESVSRNSNKRNVENNAYRSQKTVSNLYVNLRCMQVIDDDVTIYVGGGITKDSDAEAEWFETVNKSQIVKSVL